MVLNVATALYGITPGVSAAGKVVILDKSSKIDSLDLTELKLSGTVVDATAAELNALDGILASVAELNETKGLTESPLQTAELTFEETTGAGTYTGSVTLPAGSTLVDIIIHNTAVWTATTSATMKVGDVANDDGYFIGIDLKATDLVAAEAISFGYTGGLEGADLDGGESAGDHVRRRYLAAARVISGIIITVGAAGNAGRTRMTVVFSRPQTPVAATKV